MYGQTFFLSFLLLEEVRKGPYFTNSITPGTNQTQTNIQRRGVQNLLLGNMSPPQAENKCSPFFKITAAFIHYDTWPKPKVDAGICCRRKKDADVYTFTDVCGNIS